MSKSKAYRSTDVKNVVLDEVLSKAAPGRVTVGTDIGKFWIFAVLRFSDGTFLRPWKVGNPSEIEYFVWLLQRLSKEHDVTVAMESTGTYGDALRSELAAVGLGEHHFSTYCPSRGFLKVSVMVHLSDCLPT